MEDCNSPIFGFNYNLILNFHPELEYIYRYTHTYILQFSRKKKQNKNKPKQTKKQQQQQKSKKQNVPPRNRKYTLTKIFHTHSNLCDHHPLLLRAYSSVTTVIMVHYAN